MTSKYARIFMLEPDEDDRLLTRSIFTDRMYPIDIRFFSKQKEMLEALDKLKDQSPHLFLLNADMRPDGSTLDLLHQLKSDSRYKKIPIVVISNGMIAEVVAKYYESGANSFIQKPFTNNLSVEKIDTFIKYWFEVAELPV